MAKTKETAKITVFVNFAQYFSKECVLFVLILVLNCVLLSVLLYYMSKHVYFFRFFAHQLLVCGTGAGNCDFFKLILYMVLYYIL